MNTFKKIIIFITGTIFTILCLYFWFVYQKNSIDYLQKSNSSEWKNENVTTLASFKIGQAISESRTPWCKSATAPCLVEKGEYYKGIGVSGGIATTRLGWNRYLSEYNRPKLEQAHSLVHSPNNSKGAKEWIVHFNSDSPLPMNGFLPFGVNVTVKTCDGIIEEVTINHLVAGASIKANPLYAKAVEWYGAPQENRLMRTGVKVKRPVKSFTVQRLESVWNGEKTSAIFTMDIGEENYSTISEYSLKLHSYPLNYCSEVEPLDESFLLREQKLEQQRQLDNELFK